MKYKPSKNLYATILKIESQTKVCKICPKKVSGDEKYCWGHKMRAK